MFDEATVVEVTEGKLNGKIEKDVNGKAYYSFKGVPYAKPPLGYLRFKEPRALEKWTGVRNAIKDGSPSVQENLSGNTIGSEDCLYLNIFTPNLPIKESSQFEERLKPVMVWIHGGYNLIGSNWSNFFGPQYLITKDIVLVTVNYRLGLLGFLNCEDRNLEIPGNAAYKDIVMALKWIKSNIHKFMGNPDNVTIFGQSSGSIAVHLLVLSPITKGLFNKAIMHSSTSILRGSYSRSLKDLAQDMGFLGQSEAQIVHYLRKCSIQEINSIQRRLQEKEPFSNRKRFVGLAIETPSKTAFLTRCPYDIMQAASYNFIPLLMGYNSNEGTAIEFLMKKYKAPVEMYWTRKELLVPEGWNLPLGSSMSLAIADRLTKHYLPSSDEMNKSYHGLYKIFGDMFARSVLEAARIHSRACSTYIYKLTADTEFNIFKNMFGTKSLGVCHGDELGYLFHSNFAPEVKPGSAEEIAQSRILNLWTNFSKFGDPTPFRDPYINIEWRQTEAEKLTLLEIGDSLKICENPENEMMSFWDELESWKSTHAKL